MLKKHKEKYVQKQPKKNRIITEEQWRSMYKGKIYTWESYRHKCCRGVMLVMQYCCGFKNIWCSIFDEGALYHIICMQVCIKRQRLRCKMHAILFLVEKDWFDMLCYPCFFVSSNFFSRFIRLHTPMTLHICFDAGMPYTLQSKALQFHAQTTSQSMLPTLDSFALVRF